jgi:hypothetical protein
MKCPKGVRFAAMLGCIGILGFQASITRGDSLGLTSQNPDLFASFLTIDYSASGSTGTLTVTGWPTSFNINGIGTPNYPLIGGNDAYSITAQINKTTGQPVSGILDVTGTIAGLASSGTLLTGQLTRFGFMPPPGGDVFEFIFAVTGGDLAPYYHGQVGVEVTATTGSGFDGSFTASFDSLPSETVADNFPLPAVPEPAVATQLLGALAMAFLAMAFFGLRRRSAVRATVSG